MPVIINRRGASAVLHNVANATYVVAGNNSVSNVAMGDEVLTDAAIAQVWWGVSNTGFVSIKRNTSLVFVGTQSGHLDFAGEGCSLVANSAHSIVVEFVPATANGFIMIEVQKSPNKVS